MCAQSGWGKNLSLRDISSRFMSSSSSSSQREMAISRSPTAAAAAAGSNQVVPPTIQFSDFPSPSSRRQSSLSLSARISLHLYRLFVDTSIYPLSPQHTSSLSSFPSLSFHSFADLISFASLASLHTTTSTSLYIQLLPHLSEISSSSF